MLRLMLASATALALFAVRVDAQTVTRWTPTWTDDTYRYVNGERVPLGEQSALLSVMPTRGFRFSMQLELALTGDRGTGTRRRLITGPPGIEVPEPPPTRITAERAP